MEVPKYHELIRPIKEMVCALGQRAINLIVPEYVFDDFLAGGPLDQPMSGEIGGVIAEPTLWE